MKRIRQSSKPSPLHVSRQVWQYHVLPWCSYAALCRLQRTSREFAVLARTAMNALKQRHRHQQDPQGRVWHRFSDVPRLLRADRWTTVIAVCPGSWFSLSAVTVAYRRCGFPHIVVAGLFHLPWARDEATQEGTWRDYLLATVPAVGRHDVLFIPCGLPHRSLHRLGARAAVRPYGSASIRRRALHHLMSVDNLGWDRDRVGPSKADYLRGSLETGNDPAHTEWVTALEHCVMQQPSRDVSP
jgi:hypothetical protein